MFQKALEIVRAVDQASGLRVYYSNLQKSRQSNGPTFDEARRDFKQLEFVQYGSFRSLR